MKEILIAYLSGAVTLGYFVAAVFFLRFWRKTRDRLFLAFAISFGLLALNQAIAMFFDAGDENTAFAYGLRVLGFILILVAIVDKNVSPRRGR
jgi:peptidoglycan/LPS O-acetylase OafA/YrhL